MARFRGQHSAFGAPGLEPRWTDGNKDGIGTAFSQGSPVWFTIHRGILSEIYYPAVDRPQMRDLEFLFANDDGLFLEEKRDFETHVQRVSGSQAYRVTSRNTGSKLSITKEIISDPLRPCVLMRAQIDTPGGLRSYVLCSPHIRGAGFGNNAFVVKASGIQLLVAEKNNYWMAVGSTAKFIRLSCGYVGKSDGYTDLREHHRMTYEFDEARNGNVALTAELNISSGAEFTIGIAFGETVANAIAILFQSLAIPFKDQCGLYVEQWRETSSGRLALNQASTDDGRLFDASCNILLTHEDKRSPGAFVASLSIPWGAARNDENGRGGYHLVWTRDLVESALGLLAAGNEEVPLRALIYLASRQGDDGGFPQNFWVNGKAFRDGMQLDEVAFPVLLAWRLRKLSLLGQFDPSVMVERAISFLMHSGPVTGEERWEEASGYSPSTLGVIIAAFISAACIERAEGKTDAALFLESYADYLRSHLEEWTVTTQGSLIDPKPARYFVRLNPAKPGEAVSAGAVDRAMVSISNQPPGSPGSWPARDVVDTGFLQLTRYGILSPHDPLILESLRAVDAVLRAETPSGPCWHRYNHDGYGQKPDGGPYVKWGQGRLWPLLTGERGHYELAVGRDPRPFLQTMEKFANGAGLLPEQVWDGDDIPAAGLHRGGATHSANPLLWAHSEYLRLLRSAHDHKVFDLVDEVVERYQRHDGAPSKIEFWLPRHPIPQARKGHTLRICAPAPFRLHWSSADESHAGETPWRDTDSRPTGIGGEYVDIAAKDFDPRIEFTLFWKDRQVWEGRNFQVEAYQ